MPARWRLRLLWSIVVLLVASIICFLLSLLVPGGSARQALVAASVNLVVVLLVGRMAMRLQRELRHG